MRLFAVSSSLVVISSTVILLCSFHAASIEARYSELRRSTRVPAAVLAFGDSIIDPGNNNDINTVVKCNFPPYGKDFKGGQPSGRFSNGRIPTDMIAEGLGIKSYVPAYLEPNLQPEELLTGVSFASGASGYDPETSRIASAIPLSAQLDMFKEYISRATALVGEERTRFILTNSLFAIISGSDDIANTYFDTPFRRTEYDVNSYTDLMVNEASSFIQDIYRLGARKIVAISAPPIGCVPSQRTIGGGLNRGCAEKYNEAARLFNSKLSAEIDSLNNRLQNSTVVYADIYYSLLDIIQHPQKYGIQVVNKGCCGTGLLEVSILCNKFDPVCSDESKYLFWDSYHPTEVGYEILVSSVLEIIKGMF